MVSRILRALVQIGAWRLNEPEGPMHKYYDQRRFDLLAEDAVLSEFAPRGVGECPEDVSTADGLLAAGFDVRYVGGDDDAEVAGSGDDQEPAVVDAMQFSRWLELGGMRIGSVVAKWWAEQAPTEEGDLVTLRSSWDEGAVDLFARIRDELVASGTAVGEGLPVGALVEWLRRKCR